jgi:hypothetical protein
VRCVVQAKGGGGGDGWRDAGSLVLIRGNYRSLSAAISELCKAHRVGEAQGPKKLYSSFDVGLRKYCAPSV